MNSSNKWKGHDPAKRQSTPMCTSVEEDVDLIAGKEGMDVVGSEGASPTDRIFT